MVIGNLFIGVITLAGAFIGSFAGLAARVYLSWPIAACVLVGLAVLYIGTLVEREGDF